MTASRSFRIAARLGLATAFTMFALIIIGSVVRTTGSGLACPDWPLCEGRLIPRWQFNVMIEWTHRLFALLVSVLLFATVVWVAIRRETRAVLGGLALLAVALLFAQVLLGALTVWKLLHPSVVSSHLAVALLLFVTVLSMSLIAAHRGAEERSEARPHHGLAAWFGVASLATWLQAVLGAAVSTSHAGLACPDFPTCRGEWLPAMTGLVALQMTHRFGAYTLLALLVLLFVRTRRVADPAVREAGRAALMLVVVQIGLGVMNVLMALPVWISAAHLAIATLLLGLLVASALRAAQGVEVQAESIEASNTMIARAVTR
jgi:cytochrome c oxidase assembly protein subunit 15